jgi:hypothetical protein
MRRPFVLALAAVEPATSWGAIQAKTLDTACHPSPFSVNQAGFRPGGFATVRHALPGLLDHPPGERFCGTGLIAVSSYKPRRLLADRKSANPYAIRLEHDHAPPFERVLDRREVRGTGLMPSQSDGASA